MSKNIYEILNDVNINLDELKDEEFSDFDKNKVKKKFRKSLRKEKSYKKYIAVASLAIISICLLNNNFVSYAKEIIEDISYSISEALGLESNLEDYTNIINKAISRNGMDVTLNEVLLNNDELVFTYTVKSDKKLNEVGYENFHLSGLSINNKMLGSVGGGDSEYIDEYTVKNVERMTLFEIDNDELKGETNIKIKFNLFENNKTKGQPWVFKFKANGKKLALDTEEIKINKTIQLENGAEFVLEKYTKNDMGEKIYTRIDNYDYNKNYDIKIVGIDENGSDILFTMTSSDAENPILEKVPSTSSLDIKDIKFSIHVAEKDSGYTIFNSDFKEVCSEFIIE